MPHLYVSCALSCALLLNYVWDMHFLSPLSNTAVHSASLKCHTIQSLSQNLENGAVYITFSTSCDSGCMV